MITRAGWVSLLLLLPATLGAACSGGGGASIPTLEIVVNAPFGKMPYLGNFSLQGAQLAVDQVNGKGGVTVAGTTYHFRLVQKDNQFSPATSLDNIRQAVSEKAVAVIDDGYTVAATASVAQAAGLPILVDYDGDTTLVDATRRPNVFRIAPPDDALAQKLVAYIGTLGLSIAIVHDDSSYGQDGDAQLLAAIGGRGPAPVDLQVPSDSTNLSAQALQVVQAHTGAVVVWARGPVLAQVVQALGQAGSTARVFAPPTAEDPVVRTQLADHPEWVSNITYASFRITTESGTAGWDAFRKAYEDHNFNGGGPDYHVGVKARDGKDVVQPPDWQIFPYDMVHLVKVALEKAGTVDPGAGRLLDALTQVQVVSGNGDNRGWTKQSHEGVVDDDIYFATFNDMKFKPVQDDPLSKSLPPIDQE
ncbi:MAG: ABC transporter substrate-binding protein [Candidatus Dormibacteria bacterium]